MSGAEFTAGPAETWCWPVDLIRRRAPREREYAREVAGHRRAVVGRHPAGPVPAAHPPRASADSACRRRRLGGELAGAGEPDHLGAGRAEQAARVARGAHLVGDALRAGPPAQRPGDRDGLAVVELDAVHGTLQRPVAPEPAGPVAGLLPGVGHVVLVLLRPEAAVLGEVDRDPARVLGLEPLGVVDVRAGPAVPLPLVRVR